MKVEKLINNYIDQLVEPQKEAILYLHQFIIKLLNPKQLWFLDGKDSSGKVVTNPNIGYGNHTIIYKNGTTKLFYKIGISANSSGISIYIMGLADKAFLKNTYGASIGKAKVTSYCIHFKSLSAINIDILAAAIETAYFEK